MVKNMPVYAGNIRNVCLIPSWEDLLEEEMATHSNILAWIIPQIEETLAGYSP